MNLGLNYYWSLWCCIILIIRLDDWPINPCYYVYESILGHRICNVNCIVRWIIQICFLLNLLLRHFFNFIIFNNRFTFWLLINVNSASVIAWNFYILSAMQVICSIDNNCAVLKVLIVIEIPWSKAINKITFYLLILENIGCIWVGAIYWTTK